jgi:hypothetical protein
MKADLTAAESTISDANASMASEKYKDAKAKAEAAKSSAANVTSQVQRRSTPKWARSNVRLVFTIQSVEGTASVAVPLFASVAVPLDRQPGIPYIH